MHNLKTTLGYIGGILCVLVGWYKFSWAGIFLVFATFVIGSIYSSGIYEVCDEDDEPEHDSCDGCKWNLGGGCCSINSEDECAAGGGYELWREGDDDE